MSAGKWKCPWCHGVIRAGRRAGRHVTLDQAIDRHEETCPMAPEKVSA